MTHTHAAYKRPTSEQKIYTDWKWRARNKYSKQIDMKKKKSRNSNTHIRQNRLKKRAIKRDPEVHNTQAKDPWWRRKHCKYIFTQHRSTQIHKENLGELQERYLQQHNYTRGFYTPLSRMDRFPNKISTKILWH